MSAERPLPQRTRSPVHRSHGASVKYPAGVTSWGPSGS
jgi:hypothetical protein